MSTREYDGYVGRPAEETPALNLLVQMQIAVSTNAHLRVPNDPMQVWGSIAQMFVALHQFCPEVLARGWTDMAADEEHEIHTRQMIDHFRREWAELWRTVGVTL